MSKDAKYLLLWLRCSQEWVSALSSITSQRNYSHVTPRLTYLWMTTFSPSGQAYVHRCPLLLLRLLLFPKSAPLPSSLLWRLPQSSCLRTKRANLLLGQPHFA